MQVGNDPGVSTGLKLHRITGENCTRRAPTCRTTRDQWLFAAFTASVSAGTTSNTSPTIP